MTELASNPMETSASSGQIGFLGSGQSSAWMVSNSNVPELWEARPDVVICGYRPALLGEEVGSGGVLLINAILEWHHASSISNCRVLFGDRSSLGEMMPITREMLSTGKATFSLSTTELARLLGVERPTVYSWLRDETEPQSRNAERIKRLYTLAGRWREYTQHSLGDWARARRVSRAAVVAYLGEWMNSDADSIAALVRTHPIRVEPPAYSAADRARERGIRSDDQGQERLDRLTGKRRAPE